MSVGESGSRAVGAVTWGDSPIVAELSRSDVWRVTVGGVESPEDAASLANLYSGAFQSPAYGHPGIAMLEDLARRMGGVASYDPPKPAGSGILY